VRLRLLVACLAASGSLGCFVLDELDSSAKTMKKTGPQAAAREAESQPSGASRSAWWERAFTLGSEELDEEIVRCELGRAAAEFMPRADCLTRGGVPEAPRG
jgi:hypothetical protein